ncbi:MAG: CDP-alcohol phosphatidyltransferase family protein [Oscillospiraceae bacterium]
MTDALISGADDGMLIGDDIKRGEKMNTPANKITISRIVLIPVFLVLAYTGLKYWAFAVYIIACISNVADGYIARHYNQVSNFGKFVEPAG